MYNLVDNVRDGSFASFSSSFNSSQINNFCLKVGDFGTKGNKNSIAMIVVIIIRNQHTIRHYSFSSYISRFLINSMSYSKL